MLITFVDGFRNKTAKPSQKQVRDIINLKLHIFMLTVLGICPFKKKMICSKIYASCLLGFIVSTTAASLVCQYVAFPEMHSKFETFLTTADVISLTMLYLSILYSNWKSLKSWKYIFGAILKFDENISKNNVKHCLSKWNISKFIVLSLMPLIFSVNDIFLWSLVGNISTWVDEFIVVLQHIGLFYEFQIILFIWEMAYMLQTRFQYLEGRVQNLIPDVILNQEHSLHVFENCIKDIKYKYMLLYNAVQEVNTIFGCIILFLLVQLTGAFLLDFYWIMYLVGEKPEMFFEWFTFSLIIVVSGK